MFSVDQLFLGGLAGGAYVAHNKNDFKVLYAVIALYGSRLIVEPWLNPWLKKNVLLCHEPAVPSRVQHDENRRKTYPPTVPNTWYRLCDTEELIPGKVLEVRACGQVFALWRTDDGTPVCQDAFCVHMGANLAVGGAVEDNCIKCPFHSWKFDSEGVVREIPYMPKESKCPTTKKLKTYPCKEWCGMICVYFHAENAEPEFELPAFIEEDLKQNGWGKHMSINLGWFPITPTDWVDQTGDYAHFNVLHKEVFIPFTMLAFPEWVLYFFPICLRHTVKSFICDGKEWDEYVQETGWGVRDPRIQVTISDVALHWNGQPVPGVKMHTREMVMGPAMMCFTVPLFLGNWKVFVNTTPVEGGSVMSIRTYVDKSIRWNPLSRFITWVITGGTLTQLMSDVVVMSNRIRLKKPLSVPNDGPYSRSNAWLLKNFYTESSEQVGKGYRNDW